MSNVSKHSHKTTYIIESIQQESEMGNRENPSKTILNRKGGGMEKQEHLKEILQSIIQQSEQSNLLSSQEVIEQLIQHLQG